MAEELYGTSEEGFRRIAQAVRQVLGGHATGAQRRRQPPVLGGSGGGLSIGGCGACGSAAGTEDVDLGSGVMASQYYRFYPFCGSSVYFPLAKGVGNVWSAPASIPATIPCDVGTVTGLSAEMTFTNLLRDGTVIVATDGTEEWDFKNDTFWQANYPHYFYYADGTTVCPCNDWQRDGCLTPVSEAEGLADIDTLAEQAGP